MAKRKYSPNRQREYNARARSKRKQSPRVGADVEAMALNGIDGMAKELAKIDKHMYGR